MPPFIKRALPTIIGVAILPVLVGLVLLYRAMSSNDIGEPCGENDCNGIMGEYCIHAYEGSYCSPSCEGTDECPSGWVCEHPTEIDSDGGERYGVVQFCVRPSPQLTAFQGVVMRSGTGTVGEVQGTLSGVAEDTSCNWQQQSAPPQTGFDTQWTVECGGMVLYGDGDSGYNPSSDPTWPTEAWVHDPLMTNSDGDPSCVFDGSTIRISDDASGAHGPFRLTINVTP